MDKSPAPGWPPAGKVDVALEVVLDEAALVPPPTEIDLLDDEESHRAEAFATPLLRGRYILSHALLRRILGHRLGVDPAKLRYERSCEHCGHPRHGRPRLVGNDWLSFSLSHSEQLVMVAWGRGLIGADVELVGRRPVEEATMRRVTTPAEQHMLNALVGTARHSAFLEIWTRKEAVAKALGLGLALPFSSLDVTEPGAISGWPGAPHLAATVFSLDGAFGAVAAEPGLPVVCTGGPDRDREGGDFWHLPYGI